MATPLLEHLADIGNHLLGRRQAIRLSQQMELRANLFGTANAPSERSQDAVIFSDAVEREQDLVLSTGLSSAELAIAHQAIQQQQLTPGRLKHCHALLSASQNYGNVKAPQNGNEIPPDQLALTPTLTDIEVGERRRVLHAALDQVMLDAARLHQQALRSPAPSDGVLTNQLTAIEGLLVIVRTNLAEVGAAGEQWKQQMSRQVNNIQASIIRTHKVLLSKYRVPPPSIMQRWGSGLATGLGTLLRWGSGYELLGRWQSGYQRTISQGLLEQVLLSSGSKKVGWMGLWLFHAITIGLVLETLPYLYLKICDMVAGLAMAVYTRTRGMMTGAGMVCIVVGSIFTGGYVALAFLLAGIGLTAVGAISSYYRYREKQEILDWVQSIGRSAPIGIPFRNTLYTAQQLLFALHTHPDKFAQLPIANYREELAMVIARWERRPLPKGEESRVLTQEVNGILQDMQVALGGKDSRQLSLQRNAKQPNKAAVSSPAAPNGVEEVSVEPLLVPRRLDTSQSVQSSPSSSPSKSRPRSSPYALVLTGPKADATMADMPPLDLEADIQPGIEEVVAKAKELMAEMQAGRDILINDKQLKKVLGVLGEQLNIYLRQSDVDEPHEQKSLPLSADQLDQYKLDYYQLCLQRLMIIFYAQRYAQQKLLGIYYANDSTLRIAADPSEELLTPTIIQQLEKRSFKKYTPKQIKRLQIAAQGLSKTDIDKLALAAEELNPGAADVVKLKDAIEGLRDDMLENDPLLKDINKLLEKMDYLQDKLEQPDELTKPAFSSKHSFEAICAELLRIGKSLPNDLAQLRLKENIPKLVAAAREGRLKDFVTLFKGVNNLVGKLVDQSASSQEITKLKKQLNNLNRKYQPLKVIFAKLITWAEALPVEQGQPVLQAIKNLSNAVILSKDLTEAPEFLALQKLVEKLSDTWLTKLQQAADKLLDIQVEQGNGLLIRLQEAYEYQERQLTPIELLLDELAQKAYKLEDKQRGELLRRLDELESQIIKKTNNLDIRIPRVPYQVAATASPTHLFVEVSQELEHLEKMLSRDEEKHSSETISQLQQKKFAREQKRLKARNKAIREDFEPMRRRNSWIDKIVPIKEFTAKAHRVLDFHAIPKGQAHLIKLQYVDPDVEEFPGIESRYRGFAHKTGDSRVLAKSLEGSLGSASPEDLAVYAQQNYQAIDVVIAQLEALPQDELVEAALVEANQVKQQARQLLVRVEPEAIIESIIDTIDELVSQATTSAKQIKLQEIQLIIEDLYEEIAAIPAYSGWTAARRRDRIDDLLTIVAKANRYADKLQRKLAPQDQKRSKEVKLRQSSSPAAGVSAPMQQLVLKRAIDQLDLALQEKLALIEQELRVLETPPHPENYKERREALIEQWIACKEGVAKESEQLVRKWAELRQGMQQQPSSAPSSPSRSSSSLYSDSPTPPSSRTPTSTPEKDGAVDPAVDGGVEEGREGEVDPAVDEGAEEGHGSQLKF